MKFNKSQLIAFLLMLIAAVLYRAMPGRPWGFAPQWSIALFSGAMFVKDKKWAFIFPFLSLLCSDAIYQVLYLNGWFPMPGFYGGQWFNYLLFISVAFFGFFMQSQKPFQVIAASLAAPTYFFLVSNFFVWLGGGGFHHPKTFSGLLATYWDGIPFYLNSVISTIIFSCILFSTFFLLSKKRSEQLSGVVAQ
ncbi:MAG: hypothetical protein EBX50_03375 [Chitinophagia bacterium]|nr:hypothetical protein [Chitinophagia bacterium]